MSAAPAETLIRARNIDHFFGSGSSRAQVLFGNNLDIRSGQIAIMTGPSGSGKTTLLTLLGGLRSVQSGELTVLGQSLVGRNEQALTEIRRSIGFIFQMHNLLESLTAIENVTMAAHLGALEPSKARAHGIRLLEQLGLGHRINHKPAELSGGQRQRVAVARALINSPKLILADEPTAALDKASSLQVLDLLSDLTKSNGSAVVIVTHDNRIIDRADRLISMIDGKIAYDNNVEQLLRICEYLRKIEYFSGLGSTELSAVAEKMLPCPFEDRQLLIRQDEVGDKFYLLLEGQTSVRIKDGDREHLVADLGPGQFFGERALITDEPRNASIVSRGPGLAYTLDKESFLDALARAPSFENQIKKAYFHR